MNAKLALAEGVCLGAAGACTPLGMSLEATWWASAAGLTAFAETRLVDSRGEPIVAARLASLGEQLDRTERMCRLATTALTLRLDEPVAAFVALPERNEGAAVDAARIEALLVERQPSSCRLFAGGRGAFFVALSRALEALSASTELALVGGIDSLSDQDTLWWLRERGWLLAPHKLDGRIVGEAAAFAWLGRKSALERAGITPVARLVGCATAVEAEPFSSGASAQAGGLSAVLSCLRTSPDCQRVRPQRLYGCQPTEGYWQRELAYACLRNSAIMPEPMELELLAETLGDVGAAAGAAQLALALRGIEHQRQRAEPLERLMIYGCSDSGAVGACILSAL